ncbi:LysR family transcriptional regulator [Providencia hangzhouensis]|uniref:Hca operon transcriptional activator n=1 Tax=Providencia rettgeri TaxID=587 RepID=A0A9N8CYG3_PRORE|nr:MULTISPECIES: LysR family transcriptional regulator [Providencia]EFE51811.1 LysR substrate binding domain protein [Providencia rettgeri DSM 1131]EHZ6873071.1 LysR family transcriptional regulator [Providencia rettgeri]MBG5891905.1 LysR family transcriptional regulator [Providencia rettgeri]MBG5929448.1 LysR family transcriptional regulator [Providencia rettgeri]MBI6189958.1 LysR family transcriptional regulator [Providencia rettgeri]
MQAISWRHIEIFRAVMTTPNLTEAAALLNTSQPTISRELARLEYLLQFKLFDRVKGRLQPTAQGLRFLEEVERSYYGLERIKNSAETIRRFEHAQISITCLPAFAQSLLPQVCQSFMENYPDVSITVIPQESPVLEEWLSAQRYDFGLTEHLQMPPGTEQQTLGSLNEVCVLPASHPLTQKEVLTPSDFQGQRFISLSLTDSYRQLIDSTFAEHHVERKMVMETHSASSICAMALKGIGVSIVNPLTALDFHQQSAGKLALRPLSFSIPFTVSLIRPIHRPSSQLTNIFTQHLEDNFNQIRTQLTSALLHQ